MIESLACENLTNLKGRFDKNWNVGNINLIFTGLIPFHGFSSNHPSAGRLLRNCRQLGAGEKEEAGNISSVQGLQNISPGGRETDQTSGSQNLK